MTTHAHTAVGTGTVDLRDPYPFFAQKRREGGVFRGIVMGYSKMPELEGVTIPARSAIGVCMGSTNRDERRWDRAEEFDIFRKHPCRAGLPVEPLDQPQPRDRR